jgi:hypothetical protein
MVISCASTGRNAWRNVTSINEILGEWEGILYFQYGEKSPVCEIPVMLSFLIDNNQDYICEEIYDFEPFFDTLKDSMIDDDDYFTKDELWEIVFPYDYILEDNHELFYEKYNLRGRMTVPFEERDKFECDNYQIDRSGNSLKWLVLKWLIDSDTAPEHFIMQEEIILQRRK